VGVIMENVKFDVYDEESIHSVTIFAKDKIVDKLLDEFDMGNDSIYSLERLIKSKGLKYKINTLKQRY